MRRSDEREWDMILRAKARVQTERFERLKIELDAAFAAPPTAYEDLDAETVIRRNGRR